MSASSAMDFQLEIRIPVESLGVVGEAFISHCDS